MATIGEARAANLAAKAARGTYCYGGMSKSQSRKVGRAALKAQREAAKRKAFPG